MEALPLSSEQKNLDPQQEGIIRKLFAGLPKNIGRIGNGPISLEGALRADNSLEIPPFLSKKGPALLKALLMPDAEKVVVQGEHQPLIFGAQSLFKILVAALKGDTLNLNVGMSAGDEISPMYPSYLELGLQRLEELLKIGVNTRLRVFSTASLSPHFNGADKYEVRRLQEVQYGLALHYVQAFYPQLAPHISLKDILQEVELMEESGLCAAISKIRTLVSEEIVSALESCGQNHGGDSGAENALAYAAYHRRADVFQDEGPVDNIISVGGPGEALFNEVRFTLSSADKANLGIVVPKPLIARTPPYLKIPNGLSMCEFIEDYPLFYSPEMPEYRAEYSIKKRVVDFMRDPKANKHRLAIGGAQNMIHLGRCLSDNHGDVKQGLERLHSFLKANIRMPTPWGPKYVQLLRNSY